MIFGTNMMTLADSKVGSAAPDAAAQADDEASALTGSAVELGTAFDFEDDDLVISADGNGATVSGTTLRLGAPAAKACGIEIVNPYSGRAELTEETQAEALENTGIPLNAYVKLYDNTSADDESDDYYRIGSFYTSAAATAAGYTDTIMTIQQGGNRRFNKRS